MACAALRAMLSTAWISCSLSPLMRGKAHVVVAADGDALRKFREDQAAHPLQHLVHVERRRLRQAMGSQQPVHQRLQAVGLLHDHLRVLVQPGALELPVEQLRRAADAAQRILDLVREVANQLAGGLALVEQALFARDLELLVDMAEFQQQLADARDTRGQFDRRHRARQVQPQALVHLQLDVVLGIARSGRARMRDRGHQAPRCR